MLLFIFDMDEVLYGYNWQQRMAGMTELTGLSLERLRELWWHEEGEMAAEAGGFATAEVYLAAFNDAIGVDVSEADWVRVRGGAMEPWRDSIAAVRRAAELGQVTLLTNNGPMTGKHLHQLAPELVAVFGDHLFTSSDYGARKPEPEVFRNVLERYGISAQNTFFADDMQENIDGALSVGITAHHFTDAPSLLAAIEEFAAARQG
ncbi:HAD family phosphatase [Frigoribacterium sp. CG_9.8]|uniref:HAD family hydrolase n=1 Tax=Frigoribacterium sp. CG_9.8 TaxID=2787733 RepID=UPI001A23EDFE|nr:HAD family phosphatase [Frigoribacterium sp. CG_9.8]MBG6107647.1 putative hydrolase of the HAD superfamily [Frigoribacterium sp. CG_9.8]